ncbi:methyltransferase domain-containing protein [Magnetospirillum molischianum]|uniref:Putative enzyme n=1 Tax=Magnetospirillum molischianum DSM 120 TaxID=1150626 RepID=H8FUN0_MAGML|nr:methyltransferase domain-containing protein [Magnetospirillum molischianum]CCG42068.1 putative enzyme [Magnetospirillum molischianum DSM 120]
MQIFDRLSVRRNRDRAAAIFSNHDFMVSEVADRLADRLDDVTRRFPVALDLGCHGGEIAAALQGRGGIEHLIQCDLSPKMASRAAANGHPTLAVDEEWLPFAPASFDLVLSCLSLHLVNDLPGTLLQIRRILKPGGLLLAALPGAGTLAELRQSLIEAELAAEGGASPRVAPFADIKTLGALLPRAGFIQPVADAETISVRYADPIRLLADLRGMGEANAQTERRRGLSRRATLFGAVEGYRRTFAGDDGRVPATLELITLTGWAPDP